MGSLREHHSVRVSPRHSVAIDDDYYTLIRRAPEQDFVVRTLARKMAGNTPLMTGDLVIAGRSTRDRHPLANSYPLHFRKTYYAAHLGGDTRIEFERHTRASEAIGVPPPIGHAGGTFRSCLLPGRPFDQILPFGSEPPESNIRHAERLTLGDAAGLWLLAERMMSALTALHEAGLTHGDAELHNFIVCHGPLDVVPIDFDMAVVRGVLDEDEWQRRCAADLDPLLKIAIFLQCALGAQEGPLAVRSLGQVNRLFPRDEPFRRAIDARARLLAPALPLPG
ncbi:MAG TPA: hypothetical protein VEK07_24960 [Polyangiaceae bacterium]|nr:hypothetical protein [Polyangiaceae bacterium]